MREAVIIAAVRAAVGKFQGSLSPLSAVELGAYAVCEAGIDSAPVMKMPYEGFHENASGK
jgi:acetyl-CoA acetyltransferase